MKLIPIILFLILVIISFLYENLYLKNCNKTLYTYFVSLLHHIGSIYVIFGSVFFNNYIFHVLIVIFIVLLWKIFNGRCIITLYYNKLCGLPKKSNHKDILYFINSIINVKNFHYYVAGIVVIFDLFMILRNNVKPRKLFNKNDLTKYLQLT